jgi:hypothetical protein
MKDLSVSHVFTNGQPFPDTEGVDETSPGAKDGTEYVKVGYGEWWGAFQAIMKAAGKTPSGSTELADASDILDSLQVLFWPENMITGYTLANNVTDADHDVDVSTGRAMDSTNSFLMRLTSGLIKQIDASWAVGTNAGGMFTGTVANNTWYAVFAIRADADGSVDVGFDVSPVAANIPGGYTAFRRIGWVLTDGSANILSFSDIELAGGSTYREWSSLSQSLNGAAHVAKTSYTVQAPIDSIVRESVELENTVTAHATVGSVAMTDVAPSATYKDLVVGPNATVQTIVKDIPVDSSSQIASRNTAGTFDSFTVGYTDTRL